eukprot:2912252-Prymnesium_polylepis.2
MCWAATGERRRRGPRYDLRARRQEVQPSHEAHELAHRVLRAKLLRQVARQLKAGRRAEKVAARLGAVARLRQQHVDKLAERLGAGGRERA